MQLFIFQILTIICVGAFIFMNDFVSEVGIKVLFTLETGLAIH